MKEEWRTLPNWDAYEVSNKGKVRRCKPSKGATVGAILKPVPRNGGYQRVNLRQDGRGRQVDIQILVAETFIGPRPDGFHAAHDDGNMKNNDVSNIFWKSVGDNDKDKDKHGTRPLGSNHTNSILNEAAVLHIRSEKRRPRVAIDLAEQYGVMPSTIRNIRAGFKWNHVKIGE